jgi:hypothetical protein
MFKNVDEWIDFCIRNNIGVEKAVEEWRKNPNAKSGDVQKIRNSKLGSSSINPTGTDYSKGSGGTGKSMASGFIGFTQEMFNAAINKNMPSINEEGFSIPDFQKIAFDSEGKLRKLSEIGENIINSIIDTAGDQILLYIKEQSALIEKINTQAGMTGEYAARFREELTNANPRLLQLGIGFDDLARSANIQISQSGKFATINQQTWERAGEVAKAYVGELEDLVGMYPEFEKVGLGAADAQERIAKAGRDAISLGLQAQKVTKELSGSLSKINEYGFKNGIEGLSQMVRKATEFRMSMNEVFKIADKVMNPEGAVELAANLQVLGGAIGAFNDPMQMMYMATNNVEGLQDALIGAASSLSTYNSEQGRFEITGVNLRRAKEMAVQLGISYDELSKGAIAAAERSKASTDLMARGLELSNDQKEFLTNISQMKGGRMVIELNTQQLKEQFGANEVALDTLTQDQANNLIRMQNEFKKMSENDIVRQQATDIGNIKRDMDFMVAMLRKTGGRTAENIYKDVFKSASGMTTKEVADKSYENTKEFRRKVENKEFNLDGLSGAINKIMTGENKKGAFSTTTSTTPKPESTPVASTKSPEPDVTKIKSDVDGLMANVQNKAIGLLNMNITDMVNYNFTMAKNTTDSNKFLSTIDSNISNLYKITQGQIDQSKSITKSEPKSQGTDMAALNDKGFSELVSLSSTINKNTNDSKTHLGSIDNNMSNLYKSTLNQPAKPQLVQASEIYQSAQNNFAYNTSKKDEDINKTVKESKKEDVAVSKYAKLDVNINHSFNGPVIYDSVKKQMMNDPEFTVFFAKDGEFMKGVFDKVDRGVGSDSRAFA